MRKLTLIVCLLSLQTAFADVDTKIENMANRVIKKIENGRLSDLNDQQKGKIRNKLNNILNILNQDEGNNQSSSKLICTPKSSYYVVISTQTGLEISGSFYTESSCQNSIKNSASGMICSPNGTYYNLVSTKNGKKIGEKFYTESSCINNIKKAKKGLVCSVSDVTYYKVFIVKKSEALGEKFYTESSCLQSIESATNNLICLPNGAYYNLYNTNNGMQIGSKYYSMSSCKQNL